MGEPRLEFSCVLCDELDIANPFTVPSMRVTVVKGKVHPDPELRRMPVCRTCARIVNDKRVAAGLEPNEIDPTTYKPIEER